MFNAIERVGFAGLGAMGAGTAQRLADAGHGVTVWNRTRAKAEPLLAAGMEWAGTPRALAASCDVVFTMLTNSAAIEATADGEDGILAGLRPGSVWADLSTIAPDVSVALAGRAAAQGAHFLDCPVSGSPATLAAGQMSVMAGGDRGAFDHVEPVLRAIGPKVTYVGENGHAILTKVAINLALVVSVTAFAEGWRWPRRRACAARRWWTPRSRASSPRRCSATAPGCWWMTKRPRLRRQRARRLPAARGDGLDAAALSHPRRGRPARARAARGTARSTRTRAASPRAPATSSTHRAATGTGSTTRRTRTCC